MSFMYLYKYVDEKDLVAILAMKCSAGVQPEVNMRLDVTRSTIMDISGPTKKD